ncbi:NAD(P)H-dependent oxidoreductase [Arachidicoccus soli]|uniref:Flavodoxin family protein n=1 Tax=Arachidicoccus soli TaxID=2341117 RepID=A0A386HP48_9BACT|nr:NAD(P)H-dependent oxidoreductase [Arachidicoccus soli]AYD47543.1 flavodoxin family protein [Arachidicoccus soli]
MKDLVILAHPIAGSLNHQLMQTTLKSLQNLNHQIEVRDLYRLNFNPVLSLADMKGQRIGEVAEDVKREQEYIVWAEQIIFIYPIWWTGMPALLKGYIDRVFSYGFAYQYDQGKQKGLLTGKQTIIINTHGKSHAEYKSSGMDKALSLTSDVGVFTYCGLKINKHFFFDKADKVEEGTINFWKQQICQAIEIKIPKN